MASDCCGLLGQRSSFPRGLRFPRGKEACLSHHSLPGAGDQAGEMARECADVGPYHLSYTMGMVWGEGRATWMNSDQEWGCEWTLWPWRRKEGSSLVSFPQPHLSPLWGYCGA